MATVDLDHMSRNGAPPKAQTVKPGNRWWMPPDKALAEDEDSLAKDVTASLSFMRSKQSGRLSQWVVATRLYGNQGLNGRNGVSYSQVAAVSPWLRDRISWNIVQSVCDTIVSNMIKNKPKPIFLTSGGDWKMQRKAKKLNMFVEGVFYENKAYTLGPKIACDATVWGDGIVHVYTEGKRVKWERVLASELWVDDLDGFYGAPRGMHRVTDIDRHVLLRLAEKWLEGETKKRKEFVLDKIKDAEPANPDDGAEYLADKVTVAESWHLPSGDEATDGVHAISIEDVTIFREEWKHDFFPFAFLHWSDRLHGFWGQGVAEQLQNLQFEINTLLQTIKQSFWKGGTFRVFLPSGSRLVKDHITNLIGSVITYSGDKAPVIATPPLVQREIFAHLENLWQKGYEQSGVSQLQATSEKPQGLDSGEALREYNDIQTNRFMRFGQAYEEFFLDLARISISMVKDLVKGSGSYKVKAPLKGNAMKEIDWKDVNLREDEYVMRCFPISSLPSDPAGRISTITEMVQAGWINSRQGRRLIDFPDLDMADSLATAAEDYLTEILEGMLDEDGEYVEPEPYDDLTLARELALEHYQRAKVQHVPENKLELLRRFMQALDRYEATAQALAMQGGPPAPGAPTPGAGAPTPGGPGGGPPGLGQGMPGRPSAKPPEAPTGGLMPNSVVAGAQA